MDTAGDTIRPRPASERPVARHHPSGDAGRSEPSAPTAQPAGAARRQPPAVAPLPTIRVTIGRVEVRTTPAPEPASARRPERPRAGPSLDEYLRSRRGDT